MENARDTQERRRLAGAVQDLIQRIRQHNANPPDRHNAAAVNAYNSRANALNAEMARLRSQLGR